MCSKNTQSSISIKLDVLSHETQKHLLLQIYSPLFFLQYQVSVIAEVGLNVEVNEE